MGMTLLILTYLQRENILLFGNLISFFLRVLNLQKKPNIELGWLSPTLTTSTHADPATTRRRTHRSWQHQAG